MKSVQRPVSPVAHLRVGESTYDILKSTLRREPGAKLANLDTFSRDRDGRTFIDRDGPSFRNVAHYLRSGRVAPGLSSEARRTLQSDARFYGLAKLSNVLTRMPDVAHCTTYQRYVHALALAEYAPVEAWRAFKATLDEDVLHEEARGFLESDDVSRFMVGEKGKGVNLLCHGVLEVVFGEEGGAWCRREHGKVALRFLRHAAQRLPEWPDVHAFLARAYLLMNTAHLAESGSESEAEDTDAQIGPSAAYALKHAVIAHGLDPNDDSLAALQAKCLQAMLENTTVLTGTLASAVSAYATDADLARLTDAVLQQDIPKPFREGEDLGWSMLGYALRDDGKLIVDEAASQTSGD